MKRRKSKNIIGVTICLLLVLMIANTGCFGPSSIEVKISYSGSWRGAIVDSSGSRSIDGYGTESYSVSGGIISATAQKMDVSGSIKCSSIYFQYC